MYMVKTSSEGAVMFSPNKDVEYFVEKSGGYKTVCRSMNLYTYFILMENHNYIQSKRNFFESSPKGRS